jgi:hypothetical protein
MRHSLALFAILWLSTQAFSQKNQKPPAVTLQSGSPIVLELFIAPVYPPIAKLVDAAGLVSFYG